MLKDCKVDEKNKTVTIVMDLEEPEASGSGKSMVIASTGGIVPTSAKFQGKTISAGINIFYKNPDYKKGG